MSGKIAHIWDEGTFQMVWVTNGSGSMVVCVPYAEFWTLVNTRTENGDPNELIGREAETDGERLQLVD